MKSFSKWICALVAIALLAGTTMAAEAVAVGKVKAINADKKEFVLTDAAGKDFTVKLGDAVVINRGGKESQSDLKTGDAVSVMYDKGVLTWTAEYILVQEGTNKTCELAHGAFKGYDADKKHLSFTDAGGKELTFAMGDAKVRLNKEDGKIEDMKIGDKTLVILDKSGDKTTLRSVMVVRK
jgi:hypothetical protein